MNNQIKILIDLVNNGTSCRGLEGKEIAETFAKSFFKAENISFEKWQVVEIPVSDNSGKYPVAVVILLENHITKKAIALDITAEGTLFDITTGEQCETVFSAISNAINSATSNY